MWLHLEDLGSIGNITNANLKVLFCVHFLCFLLADYLSWRLPLSLWMRSPSSLRSGKMGQWMKSVTLLMTWRRPYTNARLLSLLRWKTSAVPSRRSGLSVFNFNGREWKFAVMFHMLVQASLTVCLCLSGSSSPAYLFASGQREHSKQLQLHRAGPEPW